MLNKLATLQARSSFTSTSDIIGTAGGVLPHSKTASVLFYIASSAYAATITSEPYTAGYTYVNLHYSHDNHGYTRTITYDADGNVVSNLVKPNDYLCRTK